jgi:pimeloyl-ACP methyl ester carboxylesterase
MLYYNFFGKGETLVFLHGFLESSEIWNNLINKLKDNYQVITIDLPGHGKSESLHDINTIDYMAEEVISVLDELNIDRATFIGHSMGGYVVAAIADLYANRVDNIVLINSTTLPDDDAKKTQRLKACETAKKNLNGLVNLSIPNLFAKHHREKYKEEIEFVKNIALKTPVEGVCSALKGMRERPNRSSILYDFKGGIYIIVGMNDETVNPELFLTLIPETPNVHVYKFDGGHMAYIEHFDDVLNILKNI